MQHLSDATLSIDRMLAHGNGSLCLRTVLLQPLRDEVLLYEPCKKQYSATLLLCELGKVKKEWQLPIYYEARIPMCLQPFEVALYLWSQPTADPVDG